MKPSGLGRHRAPKARPPFPNSGLGQDSGQQQSGQQTSGITMVLFVGAGIAFAYWMSREPKQVVAPAPGPA